MKKYLVVLGLLVAAGMAWADGNLSNALVTSTTTNQGYLYSTTNSTAAINSVLVNNGGGILNWSTQPIGTTTTLTTQQIAALTSLTVAQANAVTPQSLGQEIFCSNCLAFNGTKGEICMSTGTATNGAWIAVTSGTAVTSCQ